MYPADIQTLGGRLLWRACPPGKCPHRCTKRDSAGTAETQSVTTGSSRHEQALRTWPWQSTFYTPVMLIRVIPSGERGWGGGRRQRRKYWSRMPGAAPKDTMLQKLPHPHRQTKPTKPSLQAAAEDPIKSSSISNLPHHGKIQTTPSNPESLKVLFLYSFPTPTP